jgi:hypothetical protein
MRARALLGTLGAAFVALAIACGCETVTGAAAPLTPRPLSSTQEPVYVHTLRGPPPGVVLLGVVSARGDAEDATVESVLGELVRQSQRLGATHLVVDELRMRYFWVPTVAAHMGHCGPTGPCYGMATPAAIETASMVARGRAFGPAGPVAPAPPPTPGASRGGAP